MIARMRTRLFAGLVLATAGAIAAAQRPETNEDESRVRPYTLPDPLKMQDGRVVRTPADWRDHRRPEIVRLYEETVYGRSPGRPPGLAFAVQETDPRALGGLATRRQVRVRLDGTDTGPGFDLLLYVPDAAPRPVPAFLGLTFHGNHSIHPDPAVRLASYWVANGPGVVD